MNNDPHRIRLKRIGSSRANFGAQGWLPPCYLRLASQGLERVRAWIKEKLVDFPDDLRVIGRPKQIIPG